MSRHTIPALVHVMTPFPWSIDIHAPLEEARTLMETHGIHHLAVTDQGNLETIISARDIERAHPPGHALESGFCVGDVCPGRAFLADVHDPLDQILDAMAQVHIGAVLVTRDGELAGIFTSQDACRLLAATLREQRPEPPPDIVA